MKRELNGCCVDNNPAHWEHFKLCRDCGGTEREQHSCWGGLVDEVALIICVQTRAEVKGNED